MDGDEMPHETAIRETFEETGVQIEILSEQLPQTHDPEAFLLHSPLCVHAVKAHEKGNAVFHIDLAFLCRPLNKTDKLPDILSTPEVHEARWIKLAEMDKVPLAKNVPEIVELAIKKLQLQSR
jgi:8-oxo-dGTP pyrophosphatase MutT (NUDIX family)